jgi:PAS domain S-box-containing protein
MIGGILHISTRTMNFWVASWILIILAMVFSIVGYILSPINNHTLFFTVKDSVILGYPISLTQIWVQLTIYIYFIVLAEFSRTEFFSQHIYRRVAENNFQHLKIIRIELLYLAYAITDLSNQLVNNVYSNVLFLLGNIALIWLINKIGEVYVIIKEELAQDLYDNLGKVKNYNELGILVNRIANRFFFDPLVILYRYDYDISIESVVYRSSNLEEQIMQYNIDVNKQEYIHHEKFDIFLDSKEILYIENINETDIINDYTKNYYKGMNINSFVYYPVRIDINCYAGVSIWGFNENNAIIHGSKRKMLEDLIKIINISYKSLVITEKNIRTKTSYKALYDNAPDFIYSRSVDGIILTVNSACFPILGYREEELVSKNIRKIVASETYIIDDNSPTYVNLAGNYDTYVKKDGSTIELETYIWTTINSSGNTIIHGIARDITDRLKLTQEQIRSQRLESLGLLAGGIGHDFNNYLTTIQGYIDLINLQIKENNIDFDELASYIMRIKQTISNSVQLSYQLITFAKGGKPVTEQLNVAKHIIKTAKLFLTGKKITPIYNIEDDEIYILADKGMISQAISNIILNAIDAMENTTDPKLEISVTRVVAGNSKVLISISNNGETIPQDKIEKIFDPYFSTKKKGTGLGLSVTNSIIRNHGGNIIVTSGKKTTFNIFLDEIDPIEEDDIEDEDSVDTQKSLSILVMDDDEMLLSMISKMLESLNHSVYSVTHGEKALELLGKKGDFDLAIIDLTNKIGMGGKELNEIMGERYPHIKTIVISGYSTDAIMSNYKQFGFDDKLVKPFSIKDLTRIINSFTFEI